MSGCFFIGISRCAIPTAEATQATDGEDGFTYAKALKIYPIWKDVTDTGGIILLCWSCRQRVINQINLCLEEDPDTLRVTKNPNSNPARVKGFVKEITDTEPVENGEEPAINTKKRWEWELMLETIQLKEELEAAKKEIIQSREILMAVRKLHQAQLERQMQGEVDDVIKKIKNQQKKTIRSAITRVTK